MAEFFGDLERLAADLYPYRWPILFVIVAVVAAITFYPESTDGQGWTA